MRGDKKTEYKKKTKEKRTKKRTQSSNEGTKYGLFHCRLTNLAVESQLTSVFHTTLFVTGNLMSLFKKTKSPTQINENYL